MVLLVDLSELFIRGIPEMHKRVGERYGPETRNWFIRRKNRMEPIFQNLMRGELTFATYWGIFCDDSEKPSEVKPSELVRLFYDEIKGKVPGTREVIESIVAHPRSFRRSEKEVIRGRPEIIMVSDHIRECADKLRSFHPEVFDLFDREYWSFERGELKSDPGFFDRLLEDLGIRARDTLFIDDLIVNCISACQSHIKCIRFTDARELAGELKDSGFVLESLATG